MDRGFTLRDIGGRLTWFDVSALIKHLPPSSHLLRTKHPDQARLHAYFEPQAQLAAETLDETRRLRLTMDGYSHEKMPSTLDMIAGRGSKAEPAKPKRKRLTAKQVREQVQAQYA